MAASVSRTAHVLGSYDGHTTLEQQFMFRGDGVDVAAIERVLNTAPLTGVDAIFGNRPGEEGPRTDNSRTLRGFSPAPGFRFDVAMERIEPGVIVVSFSQPDRAKPYLHGDFVWIVTDNDEGATLDEQINTERARQRTKQPLRGPRLSLRRWLFFRMGHRQVMNGATQNIATLLGAPHS